MMKPNGSNLEQRCPACDGLFTINAANRKRKVQCPQCRALVTLGEAAEETGMREAAAAPPAPAPQEWVARCELLQGRIETLEQQVEALLVAPRTGAPLIPEHFQNINPKSRDHGRPAGPAGNGGESPRKNDAETREIFRPKIPASQKPPREEFERNIQRPILELGLLVNAGDAEARHLAESLTETLSDSGWKVRGVSEDAAVGQGCSGVTLAASSTIPLKMVKETLHALSAVGLAVTLQFDRERGTNESVLIVGVSPEADEAAPEAGDQAQE